jgi:hypothetical protein
VVHVDHLLGDPRPPELERPPAPICARRVASSSSVTSASAKASTSAMGATKASRPCVTTCLNPSASLHTIGVPHAIASSSVIPNDALVLGHTETSLCA